MTAAADVVGMTLAEAAAAVARGEIGQGELAAGCLSRLEAIDRTYRAWAEVDRDAAARPARPGPLCGVPVGVKDLFQVAGLPARTGAGLRLPLEGGDATAVARLRAAGAVVLGRTYCTELGGNDPAPTRNPWHAGHTPGGSSSGSAVAVATRTCFATLDTQTAGDILRPAAYCGVVGFKPTYGRVSRHGQLPVAWSLDTPGVTTRTVRDAALVLDAIVGHDPADPSSSARPAPAHAEAVGTAQRPAGRPPRLGLVEPWFLEKATDEVRAHLDEVVSALRQAGATVDRDVPLPGGAVEVAYAAHRVLVMTEAAAFHEDRHRQRPDSYPPKFREMVELGLATPAVAYVQAQRIRGRFAATVTAALQGLDALLTPTVPAPAPAGLGDTGDRHLQIPWTFAGVPAVSLPSGLAEAGLPLAVQLVGPPFGEARLLRAAQWCEAALGVTLVPPERPPGLDDDNGEDPSP